MNKKTLLFSTFSPKKVGTSPFSKDLYIVDFQQNPIKTFQKSRDIAP
jgi:hypothetical protein